MTQRFFSLVLSIFVIFSSGMANGADRYWNGAPGEDDWNDPNNWSPQGIPLTGDHIKITNGGTAKFSSDSGDYYNFQIGNGHFELSRGTVTVENESIIGLHRWESSPTNGFVLVTGGTLNEKGDPGPNQYNPNINGLMIGHSGGKGDLTLKGGSMNVPLIEMDAVGSLVSQGSDVGSVIHLDGGVLSTNFIMIGYDTAEEINSKLMFNGGTLRAQRDTGDFVFHMKPGKGGEPTPFNMPGHLILDVNGGTFDTAGHNIGFMESFSGVGGLTVMSSGDKPGVITLDATTNSYLGTTTIEKNTTLRQGMAKSWSPYSSVNVKNDGVLDLTGFDGTIGALSGDARGKVTTSKAGAVTFNVGNNDDDGIFSGEIQDGQGKLSLVKLGTGSQTLIGKNSYTGGTLIKSGTLIGTTSSLQGAIKDDSWLEFSQAGNAIFKNVISGNGNVAINTPKGVFQFANDQVYTGTTTIKAGELALNEHLASSMQINNDAILSGRGSIAKSMVNSGWLKPGSEKQPGVFTMDGDYKQTSGGNLLIKLASTKSWDQVVSHGHATVGGGLSVRNVNGFIPPDKSEYLIVQGDKGREGEFEQVNVPTLPTPLELEVLYDPNDVKLRVIQHDFTNTYPLIPLNDALRKTIDDGTACGCLRNVISTLEFIPLKNMDPYLYQLVPRMGIEFKEVLFDMANTRYGQITDRLAAIRSGVGGISLNGVNQAPMAAQVSQHETTLYDKDGKTVLGYKEAPSATDFSKPNSPWSLFVTASGVFSNIQTTADLPRMHSVIGNFNVGADYRVSEHVNVGIYGGYQGIETKFSDRSALRSNGARFGLYGTGEWNGFYVNAMVGGGADSYSLHRSISIEDTNLGAWSQPNGGEVDSLLGVGYEFNLKNWRFGVNASVQYTYLGISSYTENGASDLDLKVSGQNPGSLVSTVGGNVSYLWEMAPGYRIMPTVGMAWQHQYLDYGQNILSAFDNGAGPAFNFMSPKGSRNNAFGSAGIFVQLGNHFGLYGYYTPQFGGGQVISHGCLAGINYTF